MESEMDRTYRKVLTKMPEGSQVLDNAYASIQKVVGDFKKYVMVSPCNSFFTQHHTTAFPKRKSW